MFALYMIMLISLPVMTAAAVVPSVPVGTHSSPRKDDPDLWTSTRTHCKDLRDVPTTFPPKREGRVSRGVFVHLGKTGGGYVERLLQVATGGNEVVSASNIKEVLGQTHGSTGQFGSTPVVRATDMDESGLNLTDVRHSFPDVFIIGAVRRPGQWYVSLWAQTRVLWDTLVCSDHFDEELCTMIEEYHPRSAHLNTPSDVQLFQGMMANFSVPWASAILDRYGYGMDPRVVDAVLCDDPERKGLSPVVAAHVQDRADCWLHTENLVSSLRTCLAAFEARGGVVNWPALEKEIMNEKALAAKKMQTVENIGASRLPCASYFNSALSSMIGSWDGPLAAAMGYEDPVCGPVGVHPHRRSFSFSHQPLSRYRVALLSFLFGGPHHQLTMRERSPSFRGTGRVS